MANRTTKIVLDSNLGSNSELNNRIIKIFDDNQLPNFGIPKGQALCQKWVRLALYELGLKILPDTQLGRYVDSWDFFAMLPDRDMGYITLDKITENDQVKQFGWNNEDLINYGIEDGSLLFGFYKNSRNKEKSINALNTYATTDKINKLKNNVVPFLKAEQINSNVVTHIGIFINGRYFNLVQSLNIIDYPSSSFQPVAWWPFLRKLKNKLPK